MKFAVGFVVMISFTVAANLLMKLGAEVPSVGRPIFGLLAWQTVFGIGAFGCALLIYAWLLQWQSLNVLQAFMAVQFIAVILASAVVLGEHIPPGRWIGIGLIAAGILVVGLTGALPGADAPTQPLASNQQ
jgi:drug/metabolite transporter (DMT)-like permease